MFFKNHSKTDSSFFFDEENTGNGFTPDPKRHFAVHAKGNSMQPKIQDGDICVFEWYKAGTRNGEIVLTECSEKDLDYGDKYTIKGESWGQELLYTQYFLKPRSGNWSA